jgi:hypothetical protein
MSRLSAMLSLLSVCFALACTATVTAQFVGAGILWSHGMLQEQKLVRYTGVLYGLDPLDVSPDGDTADGAAHELSDPQQLLAARVQKNPAILDRQMAIRKGADDIRAAVLGLKVKVERTETSGKVFEAYLQQLEAENTASALREVRITLESLPPKLTKDIIFRMLSETPRGAGDDAMTDVVAVIKAMPAEKIRKVIGEFKSESEREMLHNLLVELGNLHDRGDKLTGIAP